MQSVVSLCNYQNTAVLYNMKTSGMTQKKYITNGDNNIIQMRSMSIILLVFMGDIYIFLYMSNEGCFTFITHHFA